MDLEVASALTTRAVAHVRGQFGADSDPDAGWADLAVLALSGDRVAEINALRQLGQGAREGVDEDEIVRRVTARADEGDQWAAETLLYFYRVRDMDGMDALAERKRLVAMPEVRARIATMEGLYIAYADDPGSFGEVSAGILDTARPEDFAAALRATARLDRNAYVRAVQNQLRARGYYGSRGSGRLTQPTIYAINRFCRDKGIEDACFHGPLASKAIRAIAGALGTP